MKAQSAKPGGFDDGYLVHPLGGIGNQLFIYAAGRALSERHNAPLFIDDSWFHNRVDRQFGIPDFNHAGSVVSGHWKPSIVGQIPLAPRILRVTGRNLQVGRTYRETNFSFDPRVLDLLPGHRLEGYFQSPKYFDEIGEKIRQEVRDLRSPSEWLQEQQLHLRNNGPWLAIHIRRGDYLLPTTRDFHGVLQLPYYARALRIMDDVLGSLPIRVFTDDPPEAQWLMNSLEREFEVISPPPESVPLESIVLMAGSAGIICANSSFSWWGAWLGDQVERPVICPRPWFNSRHVDYRDLLESEWISVGIA